MRFTREPCHPSKGCRFFSRFLLAIFIAALPTLVSAQSQLPALGEAKPDSGDTAWMLVSTALVMLMTPALALFYGGMIRTKNVLNTLMQSFIALSAITILWVVAGYSFSFAPGSPFYGAGDFFLLNGVGQGVFSLNGTISTIPHQVFMVYQLMFAVITPALISGAIADRMKFGAYIVFIAAWHFLVYVPLAHMVWGADGFLLKLGALDFAGGLVVHISSGVSALVLAILLGKRTLTHKDDTRPHNLPMTLIGTALLWFGWFGFNAGSAGAAGGLAGSAFVATHVAAATAGLVWIMIEWITIKRPTALGFATGAVAGLVAITPASGYVDVTGALIIGAGVAFISFFAIKLKSRFGYDDTLDVFAVHGVGGIWGAIATGLLAKTSVNSSVTAQGLLVGGGTHLLITQFISVGIAVSVAVTGTLIIGGTLKAMGVLRASETEQEQGLDQTQHGEEAYNGMAGTDSALPSHG